jgi:hypothetical protein
MAGSMSSAMDPGTGMAPLRLLVLCDRPSASQEVHLFRALRRRRQAGGLALEIYSEADAAAAAAEFGHDWIGPVLDKFRPHALIFSRFAGESAEAAIDAALARQLPVITHLDDFLLEVPPDLGPEKVRQHMRPERIRALSATLARASVLYISTPALAERVRQAGFAAPVVISHLQSCADPDEIASPPPCSGGAVVVGYQGTRNHVHDLRMITPALLAALGARPAVTLELFGTIEPPEELLALGPRLRRIPPSTDYGAFLRTLRERRWHIGLAPLRPIAYNTYRTFTKWTEYTIAGTTTLASDCVVYRPVMTGGAGVLVEDGDWERALLSAIDDGDARMRMVRDAQDLLRSSYTLAQQEQQVLAMLDQAMSAHL